VRFEDREVEGPDVEHAEESGRDNELEQEDEEELAEVQVDKVLDPAREGLVMDAMREILEHRQIVVNDLKLPQRERRALEALKAAVDGRDGDLSQFVYATDRSELLEQALAILQPKLVEGFDSTYKDLVQRVGTLRTGLKDLEDAQDELLEANQKAGLIEGAADTDDKPKPPQDDASLTGPPRHVEKPPTSLTGADVKDAPKGPSTLDGPAIADKQAPPSTLYGDRKDDPPAKSTLDGPAIKDEAPPPTTLGAPEDLASANVAEPQKQKTKPWWRRPFGG
jgi:hypothetical protein